MKESRRIDWYTTKGVAMRNQIAASVVVAMGAIAIAASSPPSTQPSPPAKDDCMKMMTGMSDMAAKTTEPKDDKRMMICGMKMNMSATDKTASDKPMKMSMPPTTQP
jgi:hypothetical protein